MPPQTSAVAIQTGYFDDTKVYFSENNKKKTKFILSHLYFSYPDFDGAICERRWVAIFLWYICVT